MSERLCQVVGGCLGAVLATAASAQLSIAYASTIELPASAVDQHGVSFAISGLSGITRIEDETYAAVMDRSDKVVFFDLVLHEDGSIQALSDVRGLTLSRTGDHEGIATAGGNIVYISHEGAMDIRAFLMTDGSWLSTVTVPSVFDTRRNNLGLESLAFDAQYSWTANEEALTVDGGRSSPKQGALVRLQQFDLLAATMCSQFAYRVEPMHGPEIPFGNPGQSGLSDLVALPDGTLLAVERSLAFVDPLFLTRIYAINATAATDVSALKALDGVDVEPVEKELLYQGGHANLEGLCLGARLTPTQFALVGVVDDGDPVSSNAIVVFRLSGLNAQAVDANVDGSVDVDDLHQLYRQPIDIDADGATDYLDRRLLESYLRRHERFDRARSAIDGQTQ